MRKTRATSICLVLGLSALTSLASADSIWNSAGTRRAPLIADQRAHQAGDLLTVLIVESAAASQQANTQAEKKHSHQVSPSTGVLKFLPEAGFNDAHKFTGQGATSRSSNLTARMTVQVVRVQPDGMLGIEGTRTVVINEEKQELRLTGRVRPEDVSPENTVLSSLIADAQITYTGKGPIGKAQKPGILTRLLRVFF